MIYFVQFISILFAIALAKHDAPAVSNFEDKGVTSIEMARFHRYNPFVKFMFCLVCSAAFAWQWRGMLLGFGFAALWVYLLFDIALNISRRPKRPWDYLGLNDADGRFWNGLFGKNSGKVKATVLSAVIITLNVLYVAD